MTAIKTSTNVLGVIYEIIDASGNAIQFANGQPLLNQAVQPQNPGQPTILALFSGTSFRFTQAQAAALATPTAGETVSDATGKIVQFVTGPPVYAGGTFESPNTGGLRLFVGGVFADLNATNATDIGTLMTSFGSSGVVS